MAEKQTKSDRAEDGNADNTANMASCLCQKKNKAKKKKNKKNGAFTSMDVNECIRHREHV